MAINIRVSPQYQGMVELAGDPQNPTNNNEGVEVFDSIADIPASFDGVARVDNQLVFGSGSNFNNTSIRNIGGTSALSMLIGDSIAYNHAFSPDIIGYSKTGGTATLTLNDATSPSGITTNSYVYIVGNSLLPDEYKGYKKVTSIDSTLPGYSISFAAADSNDASGTVALGYAKACVVAGGSIGPGISENGIAHWVNRMAGNLFRLPSSYCWGVSGTTFANIANGGTDASTVDRIQAVINMLPIKPSFCHIFCGTNDVQRVAAGTQTFASLTYAAVLTFKTCIKNGIWPIYYLPNSIDTTVATSFNTNYNKVLSRWIAWVKRYAMENRNLTIADGTHEWTNPTDANGAARTGFSSDGIHPVALGASAIATGMLATLKKIFSPYSARPNSLLDKYDATYNPSGCLVMSRMGSLGGFQSAVANLTLTTSNQEFSTLNAKRAGATGVMTTEILARTDTYPDSTEVIPGNELVISFANTVSTDSVTLDTAATANYFVYTSGSIADIAAGDKFFIEMDYEFTDFNAVTALFAPMAQIVMNDGVQFSLQSQYVSTANNPYPFAAAARSQALQMPAGVNTARLQIFCKSPACVAAKLRIKHITVRKLEAGDLLPF